MRSLSCDEKNEFAARTVIELAIKSSFHISQRFNRQVIKEKEISYVKHLSNHQILVAADQEAIICDSYSLKKAARLKEIANLRCACEIDKKLFIVQSNVLSVYSQHNNYCLQKRIQL